MRLKSRIRQNLINIPGWRTNRKIVVFESDDWGSIRMPSKEVYNTCLNNGYQVNKNKFTLYDSLASEEDLTLLFDLLSKFRDCNGFHPVITANCLVANPDFKKIRMSDFEKYHFELITDTFSKYPKHNKCWELWQKAKNEGLFTPQSHGREHININRFIKDLKNGKVDAHFAFNHEMPGIFENNNLIDGNNYVVALEHYDEDDRTDKENIIADGLEIFKNLWGESSRSFIANNYTWHPKMEILLNNHGIKYIQGSKYQYIPKGEYRGFRKKYHYLGQKNINNQIYLVRNALFEPSLNDKIDWVDHCLNEISIAFSWKKPAIISTHRINFVGFIEERNRDNTLYLFHQLLKQILVKWPDVEFMSSDRLGDIIICE